MYKCPGEFPRCGISLSLSSLLQRALGTLYSDSIFVEPQTKQPRLIILPHEDVEEGGAEELQPLGTSVSSDTSSRRMLEAAGQLYYVHMCIFARHVC